MALIDNIQKFLNPRFHISNKTMIIDNCDLINISIIQKGILIVYACWSGGAIENFVETIKTIDEYQYNGNILVVDNDCMTPDFQIHTFGQVCHGWGEIFVITNGRISKQFLGRDSFQNFKQYFIYDQ